MTLGPFHLACYSSSDRGLPSWFHFLLVALEVFFGSGKVVFRGILVDLSSKIVLGTLRLSGHELKTFLRFGSCIVFA
jgi:hypothetical protein